MQEIEKLKKRVNTAKHTIILVAALTIVNTILIAVNADLVFTFSAYVPQLVTFNFADMDAEMQANSYLYIGIAIAILMALIYLALWFGAKKKAGFLIVALVLFGIDTAVLLYDLTSYFEASYLIDVAFHAWVIYDLDIGISANSKLKKLTVEETLIQQNSEETDYYNPCPQNTEDSVSDHSIEE
ncbi:MAG: hypothetical protein K2G56_06485 [Eubacterium sp.]|nr:hypothetical protein [Eubacterium sp.]